MLDLSENRLEKVQFHFNPNMSWYNFCQLHSQVASHCSVEITYEGKHEEEFKEFFEKLKKSREIEERKSDTKYCQNYTWKSIREEDGR